MDANQKTLLRAERACLVTCLLLMANFFASNIFMDFLGGNGWSGYAVDGHYFLGSHGRYTETSWTIWEYTRMHFTFNIVTIPLILITAIAASVLREHRNGNDLILRPSSRQNSLPNS